MKSLLALLLFVGLLVGPAVLFAQPADAPATRNGDAPRFPGQKSDKEVLLPNGWSLSPAGKQVAMGDFPVRVELSPDGKYAAVLHNGYGEHEVRIVSLADGKIVTTASVRQSFYGLAFSADGKQVYVSGGEDECIYAFPFDQGTLGPVKKIQVADPKDVFVVSGITLHNQHIYACGLLGDKLRKLDVNSGEQVGEVTFDDDSFPYGICLDSPREIAYVSLWGKSKVAVIDLKSMTKTAEIEVLSHPTEMELLRGGKWLFASCSNDNSVVLVDTETRGQKEIIRTSLFPQAANGSTPASICVSPDEGVLLAANADNNNIAVFDIKKPGQTKSLGFIPVGWYPTCVRFDAQGEKILVTNGKGLTSRANRNGPNPNLNADATVREYIAGLFKGTLSLIASPSPAEMSQMTKTAFRCSPLKADQSPNIAAVDERNPVPREVGQPSPIKHCVYIIKENRTYDQLFGDIQLGNGDPTLCIFPEQVTPNHHALAKQFVLLDNFYVESEVSADGHEWSMAAYATDFVEKTWPLSYRGGRGKLTYPSEGKLKISEPSSGYIWDQCKEAGVSYFSFGEFVDNGKTPNAPATTKIAALQGHFDPQFRSYDLDYPDAKRADQFIRRWNQFIEEDNLPSFIILRLPNDHTYGTRIGKPTPTAMVADNDAALGRVVDAISHSKAWPQTAIFVVQDDAQNGSDHVDAHRTVALAISPYTQKRGLDSTLYSTSSMLRTMELILGMPPMTQFDAAATPMHASFLADPDLTPYAAIPAQVDVNAKNDKYAWGAKLSEQLDLSSEDAADDLLFGEIVWRSVRGANSPMPAPVRSAFVFAEVEDDDDDDDDD
ncbi:beta-propeller fold lactonase family protein [Blastopirellula sp. JC732]|uniref:Beta-propeller fold lactonase family protein n=1 Tax=Blastopirellula sediminis TaxID=2894196 RepID=A0A9X1SFK5_9BACT|nr:alkaline phosphatase family protein [Blastopirellula sediminis]MCC9609386.1 beta-propeller fold lactonase family protein [Blastopirellula sediminis]MCC9627837.1 beta-propeller fold lactonase family protein [Blastopirellula sediminis]